MQTGLKNTFATDVEIVAVYQGKHALPHETLDAAGHDTPHLQCLSFLGTNISKGRVGSTQADEPALLVQVFHREFTIHHGHHHMTMSCFDGAVDHQRVSIEDTGVLHGLPTDTQQKSGLGMRDKHRSQIDLPDREVLCWRGETGAHPVLRHRQDQGLNGRDLRDGISIGNNTVHKYSIPAIQFVAISTLKQATVTPYAPVTMFDFFKKSMSDAANTPQDAEHSAAAPDSAAPSDAPQDIQQQLAELQARHAEVSDAYLRAKAEAENTRRRAEEEVSKARKFAVESFADSMLPVKDSLEAAIATHTSQPDAPVEALLEGVHATLRQLASALERNKVLEINPEAGSKFDPNLHQAISMVPADQDPNTVVGVLQKGYAIAERVLRPALVTVAAPK